MSDARSRFVEAMKHIELLCTFDGGGYNSHPDYRHIAGWAEAASDAFADLECSCLEGSVMLCDIRNKNHAKCRASLRKEIGIE